jgi:hypothetical protein
LLPPGVVEELEDEACPGNGPAWSMVSSKALIRALRGEFVIGGVCSSACAVGIEGDGAIVTRLRTG